MINNATIGYILWDVTDTLEHGYFNRRPVNPAAVAKLVAEMQKTDNRRQYPIYAAVSKSQLKTLGIKTELALTNACGLTADQVKALEIIGIAGQHRLKSGEELYKEAKVEQSQNKYADLLAGLAKREEREKPVEMNVDGDQERDGAFNEERVWEPKDIPELKELLEEELERMNFLKTWPMILIDKGM